VLVLVMIPQLNKRYRPKADAQLLARIKREAWEQYHEAQFSEVVRSDIGERIARLLEIRYPQSDMFILQKYGQARECKDVSVSIYHPERKRWDVHCSIPLGRGVLCPTGYCSYYVGGTVLRQGQDDHLPDDMMPFFDLVVKAREAYQAENHYLPERGGDLKYPTWREIAAVLPVTGPRIIAELGGEADDNSK
jgi:hypothetical protein